MLHKSFWRKGESGFKVSTQRLEYTLAKATSPLRGVSDYWLPEATTAVLIDLGITLSPAHQNVSSDRLEKCRVIKQN